MAKYKLLVLADHRAHFNENSMYALLREMERHPLCSQIDVVSRGNDINLLFFERMAVKSLYATRVHPNFDFSADGRFFKKDLQKTWLREYDAVLLRLPHPIAPGFWDFLAKEYPNLLFINAPRGLQIAGSKAFLLEFPHLCPPMKRCTSLREIEDFRQRFPIILKPLMGYGGRGIVRIEGDKVSKAEGGEQTWTTFANTLEKADFDYLGAKFLKNVSQGDKRIVVCCGEILGAALRYPQPGKWVCNISQGGKSTGAEPDDDERAIIEQIDPILAAHGIIFYGIDTLVGDEGKRLLSEINALSVGGLTRMAEYSKRPVVRQAADLLWRHIESKLKEH